MSVVDWLLILLAAALLAETWRSHRALSGALAPQSPQDAHGLVLQERGLHPALSGPLAPQSPHDPDGLDLRKRGRERSDAETRDEPASPGSRHPSPVALPPSSTPAQPLPFLSIIRPIKGLDCEARENIRAALAVRYRGGSETIFVLDDRDDPASAVLHEELQRSMVPTHDEPRSGIGNDQAVDPPSTVRSESEQVGSQVHATAADATRPGEAAQGRRRPPRVLYCGEPPRGRTGKLNAMIAALRESSGEAVAFVDSDIRPDAEALERLVAALYADPTLGAAFAQVHVTTPAETAGDVGYNILINGFYAPAAYYAARKTGFRLPFIMGQIMVLRREAIEAIGGLESAEGQLVDDMYIGQLLARAGYGNLLAPEWVPIVQHGLDARGFWKLFVRWISFSRSGLPGTAFKLISWRRGLAYWAGLLAGAGAFLTGHPAAALLLFTVSVSVAASLNLLHRRAGGAPIPRRHFWVSFAIVLAAPVVYARILLGRKVVWRGRSYTLDSEARLADGGG